MSSKPEPPLSDLVKEAERLGVIAEELLRLAKEATDRWKAATARAEGTPLLNQIDRDKMQ